MQVQAKPVTATFAKRVAALALFLEQNEMALIDGDPGIWAVDKNTGGCVLICESNGEPIGQHNAPPEKGGVDRAPDEKANATDMHHGAGEDQR